MEIKNIEDYIASYASNEFAHMKTPEAVTRFYFKCWREILDCSNNPRNHYKRHVIFKRDGTERTLFIPDKILKSHQTWINKNLLAKVETNDSAYAYVSGRNAKMAAVKHYEYKQEHPESVLIHLDIKDFFCTINAKRVWQMFKTEFEFEDDLVTLLTNLVCLKGKLVQGAPTSPNISNICMKTVDENILRFCINHGVIYTRYSDDLYFSCDENMVKDVISLVRNILQAHGFKLNNKKTRIVRDGQRFAVLNINAGEKLQVGKEYRRKIRQEMHFIEKYGIEKHLRRTLPLNSQMYNEQLRFLDDYGNEKVQKNYLRGLLGRITYCLYINPDDDEMKQYKEKLQGWLEEKSTESLECVSEDKADSLLDEIRSLLDIDLDDLWETSEIEFKDNFYDYYFNDLRYYFENNDIYKNVQQFDSKVTFEIETNLNTYTVEVEADNVNDKTLIVSVKSGNDTVKSEKFGIITGWYSVLDMLCIEHMLMNAIPEIKECYSDSHIVAMRVASQ